jgi:hypothetical protein
VLALVAAHVGLLLVYDLAQSILLTLALLALAFGALGWVAVRSRTCVLSTGAILLVAAVLRLLLLPLPPTLSKDVLRYLWDGRVVVAGENPYRLAPEDPLLAPLRDDLWQSLDHREVPSVYPPLAQGLFAAAAAVPVDPPGQVRILKILLTLVDLFTCGALVYLARGRDLDPRRVLAYAWNPLVILEIAGMGHVDALGVLMVVLAVLALDRRVPGAAWAAAAGVLTKLIPLVLWPLWARRSERPLRFLALALVIVAVGLIPVVLSTGGVPPGLVRYGVSWEFNGPVYEPLWRGLEAVDSRAWGEALLDRLKEETGQYERWNRFYPLNYSRLHAKILLLGALGFAVLLSLRKKDVLLATGALLGAVLLCSATVYPWYVLWVLPWAALARHRAWLALSALLPLSYGAQFGAISYFPWIYLLIWLPFAALWLRYPRWFIA